MGGKCVDCNTENLQILEFDHITDNKTTEVRKISNYEGMLNESKNAFLRCCNCHFIKTKETVEYDKIDINNNEKNVVFARKYRERARNYVNNKDIIKWVFRVWVF